ncbi:MAG TPA: DNA repair protein RecN [Feifaniaceae bacterium]|nr:DNA repair protein RecN [Feifaniaceae bacterium]
MLQTLHIQNIALIERLELSFSTGFHVLTGETGAGKSIIIDAVNFVLGERANRDLIKSGAEKAFVEASFDVSRSPGVLARLEELGIGHQAGDDLIISRELNVSGKSVCRINGALVNLSTLKTVTDLMVDIHGQHEHQSLLDVSSHLKYLDAFDKNAISPLSQKVASLYEQHQSILKELHAGFPSEQERLRRMDLLRYQIREISDAKLQPGEEAELDAQLKRLSNAQAIISALENGYSMLSGEEGGALNGAAAAIRELSLIADYHAEYRDACNRLQDAYYAMEDIAYSLRDLKANFEFQPELLTEVEARLARIHLLKRKYGGSVEEVLAFLSKAQEEYDSLVQSDARREKLEQSLSAVKAQYQKAAALLMEARKAAASRFAERLVAELKALGMEKTQFEVALEPLSDGTLSADGLARAEFLLSTNAGEPVKPLQRVASGGELSRIMLAFKTIHMGSIPTVIFDEIDTGISGHIATAVGRKMRQISHERQVLCITHLPQIACMADIHFLVEKLEESGKTTSLVRELSHEERILEIARIMGAKQTDVRAMEHAKELLEQARA